MKTDKILYSYHRDEENPNRVLTIARRILQGYPDGSCDVEFQFAVCAPYAKQQLKGVLLGTPYKGLDVTFLEGDVFNKGKGRDLATRRLDHSPIELTSAPGVHPMTTIRQYLSDEENWETNTHLSRHLYKGYEMPSFWAGFHLENEKKRSGLHMEPTARGAFRHGYR